MPKKGEQAQGGGASVASLAFCTLGIYAAYLTQGVLQEKLSTRKYGPSGERFPQIVFLNFAQSVVCFAWAAAHLIVTRGWGKDAAPVLSYWRAGLTNTLGPACGVVALKNISYTAQVLAKSSKMIPVMVAGTLLYGKRYRPLEYFCAVLIAGGVSLFALTKSSGAVKSKLADPNAPLGYALVFFNLGADGYTNALQDQIKEKHPKTGACNMMFSMNLWCTFYYFIYSFLLSGTGMEAVKFCTVYNDAAVDILVFCLCGAVGQEFIFMGINLYGTVVNTTITTTRKFFNILLSVWWNGNPLRGGQWAAVGMVFSGIGLSVKLKAGAHGKKAAGSALPSTRARKAE